MAMITSPGRRTELVAAGHCFDPCLAPTAPGLPPVIDAYPAARISINPHADRLNIRLPLGRFPHCDEANGATSAVTFSDTTN
jgi:hypothetical protein